MVTFPRHVPNDTCFDHIITYGSTDCSRNYWRSNRQIIVWHILTSWISWQSCQWLSIIGSNSFWFVFACLFFVVKFECLASTNLVPFRWTYELFSLYSVLIVCIFVVDSSGVFIYTFTDTSSEHNESICQFFEKVGQLFYN